MNSVNDIPKKNPFKVPENYFEEVNHKIISETANSGNGSRDKGIYRMIRPIIAIAAAVSLFVVLSYSLVKIIHQGDASQILPAISFEDFSQEYLNDIDIMTLEEDAAGIVMYDRLPEVSSDDIIDYLVLDNLDPYEIYENL